MFDGMVEGLVFLILPRLKFLSLVPVDLVAAAADFGLEPSLFDLGGPLARFCVARVLAGVCKFLLKVFALDWEIFEFYTNGSGFFVAVLEDEEALDFWEHFWQLCY